MPNLIKIQSLLRNLETYTGYLRALAQRDRESFLSDPTAIGAAKYYLLTSTDCCLNITSHIAATARFRTPTDYADAFEVLAEQGILSPELKQRLQQMARFRNLLVHQYAKIDDERVYLLLQNNLGDFDLFAQAILTYLGLP